MSGVPYKGPFRRLVLAFDVGTTFSGISYSLLEPGSVPKICSVTRFPGQEHIASSSKIPTVLYYNKLGNVKAAGAEAELDRVIEEAEDAEWLKVQWFKLRLRPRSMSSLPLKHLTPLPGSKTATDVLGDFFRYLMSCAEHFIKDSHPTIIPSWVDLRSKATFVIAHPNGWEGAQQSRYRKAAIQAGLVPDTQEGKSRIVFVTEGEASLNFCLRGDHISKLETNSGFIVADMGGGTLDFSAYKTVGFEPLQVEEMAAARCELQGSTLVTERAKTFIKEKLNSSRFGHPSTVQIIANVFDQTVKRVYRGVKDAMCYITFGLHSDKDLTNDIRSGKLRLQAEQVAQFFDPSIQAAVNAVLAQAEESPVPVSAVYLVGGFSANPYMVAQLKERLGERGTAVHCPDGQAIKAVAEGSISYFIEHYVISRVAKLSYLTPVDVLYNPSNNEHKRRVSNVYTRISGEECVRGALSVILSQGTIVQEETELTEKYQRDYLYRAGSVDRPSSVSLLLYRGPKPIPRWKDETSPDTLTEAFTITFPEADFKHAIELHKNPSGSLYKTLKFSVVMKFGGPELKAQLAWQGARGQQRSPAEIIYEETVDDHDVCDDEPEDSNDGTERELNSVASALDKIRLQRFWMT